MLQNLLVDTVILEETFVLEIELLVPDQLNERVGDSPWMWFLHNQAFHYNSSEMFLNVLVVRFKEDQQHEIDEIISDQIRVADVVDYTVQNNVAQLQHAVSQQLNEQVVTFFADFVEFLSVDGHVGVVDIDHPGHGDHKGVDH